MPTTHTSHISPITKYTSSHSQTTHLLHGDDHPFSPFHPLSCHKLTPIPLTSSHLHTHTLTQHTCSSLPSYPMFTFSPPHILTTTHLTHTHSHHNPLQPSHLHLTPNNHTPSPPHLSPLTHSQSHTHTLTLTPILTPSHTHSHTHTHTHTHTLTHTHTHSHPHTHTLTPRSSASCVDLFSSSLTAGVRI